MNNFIETPTIGEILSEEFLIPLGISAYRLAQEINAPVSRMRNLHLRLVRNVSVEAGVRTYFPI